MLMYERVFQILKNKIESGLLPEGDKPSFPRGFMSGVRDLGKNNPPGIGHAGGK